MSQIKYLVYAFLLLSLFVFAIITVQKISSTILITKQPAVIDYVESDTNHIEVSSEGKNLFSANCATCHALDKALTGPALRGVESRGPWNDRKNLIKWVKNPAMMIPKFAYTKTLEKEFNGQIMPSFSNLTNQQIEAIFDYIKQSPSYSPRYVVMD